MNWALTGIWLVPHPPTDAVSRWLGALPPPGGWRSHLESAVRRYCWTGRELVLGSRQFTIGNDLHTARKSVRADCLWRSVSRHQSKSGGDIRAPNSSCLLSSVCPENVNICLALMGGVIHCSKFPKSTRMTSWQFRVSLNAPLICDKHNDAVTGASQ